MRGKRADGTIRRSQVLMGAGPGALLDLPEEAVLVKGLDHWRYFPDTEGFIAEPRLERRVLGALRHFHGWPHGHVRLRLPPVGEDDGARPDHGLHAVQFPRWHVCHDCQSLIHREALDEGRHRCRGAASPKRGSPVAPIRFVTACERGHLQDIHWRGFVHHWRRPEDAEKPFYCNIDPKRMGSEDEGGITADLYLHTAGTSGELLDLWVRCRRCGASRGLQELNQPKVLGKCRGWRPWLNTNDSSCDQDLKLLVRTATNAWFPINLSVLSVPEPDSDVRALVDKEWDFFERIENAASLDLATRLIFPKRLVAQLDQFEAEKVMEAILRKRSGSADDEPALREVEWRVLFNEQFGLAETLPERGEDWHAVRVSPDQPAEFLDRVVLVSTLKIVMAQVGFLRHKTFEANAEGEVQLEPERVAALSERADWVPAVELRGEGIFLGFSEAHLRAWEERPEVKRREELFRRALVAKRQGSGSSEVGFGGARLLLLHSLSHMLIRAISLECGYSASAIRERIYCFRSEDGNGPSRAGILLYTGTPGSEGTLGGLVEVGRQIVRHLRTALEMNRLCSNDPVCAQHQPDQERPREGAACHGCLLIAEPSCERGNGDLDRAFVVPTVEGDPEGVAFFGPWLEGP